MGCSTSKPPPEKPVPITDGSAAEPSTAPAPSSTPPETISATASEPKKWGATPKAPPPASPAPASASEGSREDDSVVVSPKQEPVARGGAHEPEQTPTAPPVVGSQPGTQAAAVKEPAQTPSAPKAVDGQLATKAAAAAPASRKCAGCRRPAASGFSHCCRTCESSQGKSHGPRCDAANAAADVSPEKKKEDLSPEVATSKRGWTDRLSAQATKATTFATGQSATDWMNDFNKVATEVATGVGQAAQDMQNDICRAAKDMKSDMSSQMEKALATSSDATVNRLLDSSLAATALGDSAPASVRKAATMMASRQLTQAIASEDPKQLKGALVSAKRLNATKVPEFDAAVEKYKQVKKLPAGWDAKRMILQKKGAKMVAKDMTMDAETLAKFQKLLDVTHRKIYTRDRLGQAVPEALQLLSVTTITNGELWADYMVRREAIRQEIAEDKGDFAEYVVDTMEAGDGSGGGSEEADDSAAKITAGLAEEFAEPMLKDVNEVFLFHGTTFSSADSITTGNFKVNLAGSNAGTLYGRGIYLAENSTKSDEYTRPDGDMRYILVCRAVLGRVYYTDTKEADPRQCEDACLRGKYHSVVGDRRKCRGTFREFVVFDEEQIYANYILSYKRVNAPPDSKRTFQVTVPPGASAGTKLEAQAPDGTKVEILVPSGVAPGGKLSVTY